MNSFASVLVLCLLTGCPKKSVTIYRSLSEPGAMQTCDANKRFHAEVKGSDEGDARAKLEAQMRDTVTKNGGCGAFITNERTGKALDGTTNGIADYQLCKCGG